MKHIKKLLILTTLIISPLALAMHHGHMDSEKHLEKMTKKLDLSPEQVEQVRAEHETMRAHREAHMKRMQEILNDEQWEKLQKHHKSKYQKKKQYRKGKEDSDD